MFGGDVAYYESMGYVMPGSKLRIHVYSPKRWGFVDKLYLTADGVTLGERQQNENDISYTITAGTEPIKVTIHPGQ